MISMNKSEKHSAAYLHLYTQLRDDIIKGIYTYGDKLPSKRILADKSGFSLITVEHSYSLLIEEGYIESRERSGYYVIFRNDDGFESAPSNQALSIPDTLAASTSENRFPISVLSKIMRGVISDLGDNILKQSPSFGCFELREAIRKYLARSHGVNASCEQIIIGSGSEYLYNHIVEFLGRDKTFAIESPSYKKIEQVYNASNVKIELVPLGNDGIDSNALWNSNANILHISPYRSFPSGVTASASKRHEYIRWASQNNRFIVEDDFESEFSLSHKPKETVFSMSKDENVIYLNTFSKTISPGLRVGYMVLPERLVAEYEKKVGFYACTVPTYIQYVIAELINNGDFERHINRVRRQKRRKLASRQV